MQSTHSVTRSAERERARARRWGWLVAPVCLVATALGLLLALRGRAEIFGWVLLALFGAAFTWMLVSVFFPARVDRSCPSCGEAGLERLDPDGLRGVRCSRCGFEDREASAFLIAESEGQLEESVLRERSQRRAKETGPAARARSSEPDPSPGHPETAR